MKKVVRHGPHSRGRTGKRVAASTTSGVYIAIIGDVLRSRQFTSAARRDLQRRLNAALTDLNTRYKPAIASKFLITVGDEFQGLLLDATVVPEMIRSIEVRLPDIEVRLGIGRGAVHTALEEYALGMDGPAWHAARTAIENAKARRRLGGVFAGFGPASDTALNGFARILHYVRSRLTSKQRELLEALLEHGSQIEIASRAGITRQAVSKQTKAAGGEAYREAEQAWRLLLEHAHGDARSR